MSPGPSATLSPSSLPPTALASRKISELVRSRRAHDRPCPPASNASAEGPPGLGRAGLRVVLPAGEAAPTCCSRWMRLGAEHPLHGRRHQHHLRRRRSPAPGSGRPGLSACAHGPCPPDSCGGGGDDAKEEGAAAGGADGGERRPGVMPASWWGCWLRRGDGVSEPGRRTRGSGSSAVWARLSSCPSLAPPALGPGFAYFTSLDSVLSPPLDVFPSLNGISGARSLWCKEQT